MSTDTEKVDVTSAESVVDLARRWYHIPALAVMMLYMLWVRFQSYDSVVRDDTVYFIGNDAYYHYRETMYAVENWPNTMPFDPWTQFPFGTSAGQFGTLFDQIIATAILIVGLGSPSDRQAAILFAVAPAVYGALCAVPAYWIGKRVSDRLGGLVAALVLALLPGMFLVRSVVGFTDHHVGEVLFQSLAVLALMIAVSVAEREKPVFEQFQDRDWEGLRDTIKWSVIAGLALTAYLWTWAPGVVLVGIFGVFFLLALTVDVVRGRSPEHVAIVGTITLGIAAVLLLPVLDQVAFGSVTTMSLLHVALALSVAAGCAFLAWLARLWDRQGRDANTYPVAVAGIGVAALIVGLLVVPDVVSMIWSQVQRSLLLGQSSTALTIQEAQTTLSQEGGLMTYMYRNYRFTYIVGLLGFLWLLGTVLDDEHYRTESLLVLVWAVFVTMMALTQVRFHYYLAMVVAVLNAVALSGVTRALGVPSVDRVQEIETYQVLAIAAAVVLIVFPLAVAFGAGGGTAYQQANARQPGDVATWDQSLDWMSENTPEPGTYGGASEEFPYYGSYSYTDDYQYPDGAYGVMSWWDYGHWITVEGERPATANPFQQGARTASAFFQAQSEERANALLDAQPAQQEVDGTLGEKETSELREIANDLPDDQAREDTRYVMIDDEMAGRKFGAIRQWTSPPDVDGTVQVGSQQYYNSMLGQLYFSDANGLSNYRLVHENERYSAVGILGTPSGGQTWASSGPFATGWNETFQTRLQLQQQGMRNTHVESTVKTYERVAGATITGEAEANQTVVARVVLETNAERRFAYTQEVQTDEDGTFTMTVPYATNDELGTEDGYTDSAVTATGDYSFVAGDNVTASDYSQGSWDSNASISLEGSASVPETAVVDGDSVEVEFSEFNGGNESSGNESSGDGSGNESSGDGNGTDDGQSDGDDGSQTDGGNATGRVAPLAARS